MTQRDKQIICGLFLSKFDQEALRHLGFNSFLEAFNALGFALGARPASIKNYRDEFDPYFSNPRQGWHKRPFREHCRQIMDRFQHLTIREFGNLLDGLVLSKGHEAELPELSHVLTLNDLGPDSPFARRLITGRAAENFFCANYKTIPEFSGGTLTDTSAWGCGFDFKLSFQESTLYKAVEVKGLRPKNGQIQMTDLEYRVSEILKDRYYLIVVRNFEESPFLTVYKNPLNTSLSFTQQSKVETKLTWTSAITD
jgi:hypothetical protein